MTSKPDLGDAAFTEAMHAVKAEHFAGSSADREGQARAAFDALMFPTSGYRTPPVGSLADLERMTLDDIKQWHASWYAPNNAVLVIVGDVQLNQVKALVKRHFGPLQRRALPVSRIPLETETPGERTLSLGFTEVKPRLYLAFNWPSYAISADHQQVAALRLLPYLLASRLIHDEQLLVSPAIEYLPFRRGASYFMITSHLAGNTTHTMALEKIWQQLDLLKTRLPTVDELDDARDHLQARRSCDGDAQQARAAELSELAVAELPLDLHRREREALARITPEEVRSAASLWLARERAGVAYLHNLGAPHE